MKFLVAISLWVMIFCVAPTFAAVDQVSATSALQSVTADDPTLLSDAQLGGVAGEGCGEKNAVVITLGFAGIRIYCNADRMMPGFYYYYYCDRDNNWQQHCGNSHDYDQHNHWQHSGNNNDYASGCHNVYPNHNFGGCGSGK